MVGTVFEEVNIVQLQQRTCDTGFEDFIPLGVIKCLFIV